MSIEFEVKFRATEDQLSAIRAAYPAEEETIVMETTYYDTPAGNLAARWYTLRHRLENDRHVCTLKTPVDDFGRGEFEVDCPHIQDAISELCKLSGIAELPGLVCGGLVPVCGAKFTRIAKTVALEHATVEIALDRGILTGGGKAIPLCEVEVELKSGDQKEALAFAGILSQQHGLQLEKKSKFRRALALAKGE